MRVALAAALVALALPTPSLATVGLACTPSGKRGPTVGIVFAAGGGIAAVNLLEAGRWRSSFREQYGLLLTRASADRRSVAVDFLDLRGGKRTGRLRASIVGYRATGTFALGGRRWAVRCIQD
jgi:hypothetical protein